jgi:hypothetical protein
MKSCKKFIALMTLISLFSSSINEVEAVDYCSYVGGCGYEECCAAPCLTPAIALGTVVLTGIIVLALQHSHGRVGHSHSHD